MIASACALHFTRTFHSSPSINVRQPNSVCTCYTATSYAICLSAASCCKKEAIKSIEATRSSDCLGRAGLRRTVIYQGLSQVVEMQRCASGSICSAGTQPAEYELLNMRQDVVCVRIVCDAHKSFTYTSTLVTPMRYFY